ncbi:MAG: GFA family protein [Pseudomonadota bacterium]
MARAGGCQCGAVRYTLSLERPVVYACHCSECQKQSASAFGLSVPITRADIDVTGPLATYVRPTDSGTSTTCHFCPKCGTRIYHQSARSTDNVTLKGGTLDDPSDLSPAAHIWTRRKHSWIAIPDDAPQFPEQPDDLKAWRDTLIAKGR